MNSIQFSKLHDIIPGGAHTYSRGDDQFPANTPHTFHRGKGVHLYTRSNEEYLDFGMGLRSVGIGYNEPEISEAAIQAIQMGNNLSRPSDLEFEAAEAFTKFTRTDMVKFCKNGSNATTAAVKLARAFTGKDHVLRCRQHPFFSFDDWFIGNTVIPLGTPSSGRELIHAFDYGNLASVTELIDNCKNQVACIILEPCTDQSPRSDSSHIQGPGQNPPGEDSCFLKELRKLCNQKGIVLIFDEMITGMRWDTPGASSYFDVTADLYTYGKAIANGFSIAAVAGRKEIMELGGIRKPGAERLFFLSSTHGAEMCSLAALKATLEFYQKNRVIPHIWDLGEKLIHGLTNQAAEILPSGTFYVWGFPCSPYFQFYLDGKPSMELRTIFLEEMTRNKTILSWISLAYRHSSAHISQTLSAAEKSFQKVADAISSTRIGESIEGHVIQPVFRNRN